MIIRKFKSKQVAFTLAEVLITLAVIGVIAAITLPNIIKNYQKTETVNKLKETYSTLSQAFQRAILDYGEPVNWTYNGNNLDFFVETYLAPYLKIIKKSNNDIKHFKLSGAELDSYKNRTHYYLTNGVEITVYPYGNTHYMIIADINGIKGPNKMGKDCFQFQFSKLGNSLSISNIFEFNGLNGGGNISVIKSNCSKSQDGTHCGAWIVREGWRIPNCYPW